MDVPLLLDDFKEFLKSLNGHDVDYLVVGGYAVAVTAPVDLPTIASASAYSFCREPSRAWTTEGETFRCSMRRKYSAARRGVQPNTSLNSLVRCA